jgi:hypothetical protein
VSTGDRVHVPAGTWPDDVGRPYNDRTGTVLATTPGFVLVRLDGIQHRRGLDAWLPADRVVRAAA